MLLHHFDHPLPWKKSKMATKHNYLKSLKLQSHCMPISTNVVLSSLLPRILWLLCFSFILWYYLHFMLVKNDTNNISYRHKTKNNTANYKSLGKSKDQYIYKHHADFQDSTFTRRRRRKRKKKRKTTTTTRKKKGKEEVGE